MSTFTRMLVWIFNALLLAAAACLALYGDWGLALFPLGLALCFFIIARMAAFESSHGIGKSIPGASRSGFGRRLHQYWNSPGWEGKFFVCFLLMVMAVWIIQRLYGLVQALAR